jgi:NhaP-type Na+/H+ or K+/H+ antiporter
LVINKLLDELGECAKKHPFWFSAGALAAGVGGIMLGPGLVTIGQGVMVVGAILASTGFLSVLYVDKEQAEKWISAGMLTLVAGAGIALAGFALTAAGIVAVVGGAGGATKTTVEEILRKRIEKKIREKNFSELIDISRQLN